MPEQIEVREEWYVLGHPGWPMGMDFRTQAEAESFYWRHPKLDGTREGMRVMHRTVTRYPDYVPTLPTEQWATAPDGGEFRAGQCQGHDACPVETHEHGCFADTGNCDHPEEHESTERES